MKTAFGKPSLDFDTFVTLLEKVAMEWNLLRRAELTHSKEQAEFLLGRVRQKMEADKAASRNLLHLIGG